MPKPILMRVSVVSPTVTASPLRGRETHGFIATVSIGFHQHGWRLPLLVSGTTLLVQGEATQSPCVLMLVLAALVARYAVHPSIRFSNPAIIQQDANS